MEKGREGKRRKEGRKEERKGEGRGGGRGRGKERRKEGRGKRRREGKRGKEGRGKKGKEGRRTRESSNSDFTFFDDFSTKFIDIINIRREIVSGFEQVAIVSRKVELKSVVVKIVVLL